MQASSMSEVDANTARARFFLDYLTKKTDDTAAKETASLCFDTLVLQDVTSATSTGPGNCSCELKITPRVSNSHGTLHGGCTATLVDTVGSAALATVSDRSGVSVHIGCEYLSGIPLGHTALISATVTNNGARLATVKVEIWDKETGRLCATGVHTKYQPEWMPAFEMQPVLQSKL